MNRGFLPLVPIALSGAALIVLVLIIISFVLILLFLPQLLFTGAIALVGAAMIFVVAPTIKSDRLKLATAGIGAIILISMLGVSYLSFVSIGGYNINFEVDKNEAVVGETINGFASFEYANITASQNCPVYGCGIFALYIDGERKQIFTQDGASIDWGCVFAFRTVKDFQNTGTYNFTEVFNTAGTHTIELRRTEISDKIYKSTGLTEPNYCEANIDLWCPTPPVGYMGKLVIGEQVICNQAPPAVSLPEIYDRMNWGIQFSETITVKANDCPSECCENEPNYTNKFCAIEEMCVSNECLECVVNEDCATEKECTAGICVFNPDPTPECVAGQTKDLTCANGTILEAHFFCQDGIYAEKDEVCPADPLVCEGKADGEVCGNNKVCMNEECVAVGTPVVDMTVIIFGVVGAITMVLILIYLFFGRKRR